MSFFTRVFTVALLLSGLSLQSMAQTPSCKVYKRDGDAFYFGKLYIPAGSGKLRLRRTPSEDAVTVLYYGHIDHTRIYMRQLPVTADSYFIDATDCSHTFVVRTSLPDDVVMQQATAEDDAIVLENESYYFNKALSFQNRFRYSEEEVSNSDLQTLSSFKKKNIYVMADPAVSSLSFEWLDQFGTSASLPAGSLYMVEGRTSTTPEIKILWPDDDIEIETGIKAVKSVETSAGSRRADTDAIYTLQGVRVSRTEKGRIYIRNGRKFIAQ